MAAERVSRTEVVAYRLGAHGLASRAGPDDGAVDAALVDAAARCGIQNSPPGSALLALAARVGGVTAAGLAASIDAKTLLQSWSLRGAPFLFPTADAAVFTTGVLPPGDMEVRHFLPGLGPALDELGMTAMDALARCDAEIRPALSGRRLPIGPLGADIAARIAAGLPPAQRRIWWQEGPYAAGQPLGEAVVHFCLRILTLRGVVCLAPREGNTAPFVLVEEWIGHPLAAGDPDRARTELLRRYLRCFGPSTRAGFAAWIGLHAGDVGPWWEPLDDELAEVRTDAGRAWIPAAELPALRQARMPRGVRLLPPRDPYTQLHDRGTVLDPGLHRRVWMPVGAPGTVLADGELAGTWRARKTGARLTVTVTPFAPLPARLRRELDEEVARMGALREAASTELVVAEA
ncbi:winged helix DNA-binding domain-containing protein [Agromyces archimandritae]|uniref:AlkZ family DNA glycosylase n=1 Tax=Agromyces archimandritae TaxID=2781962 RepID=A0A975FJS0_9MICO|nr:winged helix DNA-binding domain-containing protein [Agromyces archimandritae]QTX03310.1 AlkZ family DNA glycosylase [Agromyces archimandritae]